MDFQGEDGQYPTADDERPRNKVQVSNTRTTKCTKNPLPFKKKENATKHIREEREITTKTQKEKKKTAERTTTIRANIGWC